MQRLYFGFVTVHLPPGQTLLGLWDGIANYFLYEILILFEFEFSLELSSDAGSADCSFVLLSVFGNLVKSVSGWPRCITEWNYALEDRSGKEKEGVAGPLDSKESSLQ